MLLSDKSTTQTRSLGVWSYSGDNGGEEYQRQECMFRNPYTLGINSRYESQLQPILLKIACWKGIWIKTYHTHPHIYIPSISEGYFQ